MNKSSSNDHWGILRLTNKKTIGQQSRETQEEKQASMKLQNKNLLLWINYPMT